MRLAVLLPLFVLVCCAGCGGGGDTPAAGVQNTIVGRWAASTIQGPGSAAQNCPASITLGGTTYACGLIDVRNYRQDGSYDEAQGGQRGTWTSAGNTVTVTVNGQSTTYTFSIVNNILTEQLATGSGTITITFLRQ